MARACKHTSTYTFSNGDTELNGMIVDNEECANCGKVRRFVRVNIDLEDWREPAAHGEPVPPLGTYPYNQRKVERKAKGTG